MISPESLIGLVVYLIIMGLIAWLLFWLIGYAGLPAPFDKGARVVLAVVCVLVVIYLLLGIAGHTLVVVGR